MPLNKQVISIPISNGLDTKTDPFQVQAGSALVLENARFHKTGKLSKRFGLVALTNTTDTGLLSSLTVNSIVSDTDQINAVTSGGVYSLWDSLGEWGKSSEFKTPALIQTEYSSKTSLDHYFSDVDYNSTLNMTATVFMEIGTSNRSSLVLKDVETGQKWTKLFTTNTIGTPARVCITSVAGDPVIFVLYTNSSGLLTLDIYNKSLTVTSTSTIFDPLGTFDYQAEIIKDSSNVFVAYKDGANLYIGKYTLAGTSVTNATIVGTSIYLFGATDPTCLSVCEHGDNLHVAYPNSGGAGTTFSIVGVDKTTLAVSLTATTIAAPSEIVSIVADATNVYFSSSIHNNTTNNYESILGTIPYTTTYNTGAITSLVLGRLAVLAQPFIINTTPYFVLQCCESFQLNGFVVNIDGYPVLSFSPFQVLQKQDYTSGSPRKFVLSKTSASLSQSFFSFEKNYESTTVDDGEFIPTRGSSVSRFYIPEQYQYGTKVKVGESIYYTAGTTIEFDARMAHENCFMVAPRILSITTNGAAGSITAGTYFYLAIYEFYDGKGQITRSFPSDPVSILTAGATSTNTINYYKPVMTYKGYTGSGTASDNSRISLVLYRTAAGGSNYFRCKTVELINNNGSSDSTNDSLADSSITNNELIYTTGGILKNHSLPTAAFSTSGGNRVFVGGLEQRDEIAYSYKQLFGESVASNGFYRIRVSSGNGSDDSNVSALGYMDGKLIIFRSRSIYFVTGDGPLLTGQQDTFSEPEIISSDAGCEEPKSVVNVPDGIMFKSRKGIYLLGRGLQTQYIGAQVENFNDEKVVASLVSDKFNEARFYTDAGNCLVYNYLFGTWSVFTDQTVIDADNWQGSPVSIISNKVFQETEDTFLDNGASGFYAMKYTTPWLKTDLIQGYVRVYRLHILGSYKSAHTLKCRVYVDYDDSTYEEYDLVLDTTEQPQYQFQIHLPIQKVESMKFEIFDADHTALSTGEAYDLSNIQLEVGIKSGGFKLASTKSY